MFACDVMLCTLRHFLASFSLYLFLSSFSSFCVPFILFIPLFNQMFSPSFFVIRCTRPGQLKSTKTYNTGGR